MLQAAFIVPHPPLIIPQVGHGEEKQIQSTIDAFEKIAKKVKDLHPDTVVILSPHSVLYRDYIHISPGSGASGSFARFGAPEVHYQVKYDQKLSEKIAMLSQEDGIAAGFLGELEPSLDHATLIPIHFLRDLIQSTKFVRISLSGMDAQTHFNFGKEIVKASNELGEKIVLIASGDLSHVLKKDGPYGFRPEGPEFDRELITLIQKDDLKGLLAFNEDFTNKAAECGLRGFIMMAGALDGLKYDSDVLSYEGPFGVGYGCAEFIVK